MYLTIVIKSGKYPEWCVWFGKKKEDTAFVA